MRATELVLVGRKTLAFTEVSAGLKKANVANFFRKGAQQRKTLEFRT